MQEALLHHIWKFKLITSGELKTTDGETVEIVNPGRHNHDAGPDFLEAKIKIGETLWAGNVELHVRASDFILHGHETDPNYEKLILHVVYDDDLEGRADLKCATLEMKDHVSDQLLWKYKSLIGKKDGLPCDSEFMQVDELVRNSWLDRLLIDRLDQRVSAIRELVSTLNGDNEQAFLVRVARGFGQKVNADAFEQLARITPWKVLAKHAHSVQQLEAILFGQAGMLDQPVDDYSAKLKSEYDFLKAKFGLEAMRADRWKYLRLRPANFPSIRIAQLASLLQNRMPLIASLIDDSKMKPQKFEIQASEYWNDHHKFGASSKGKPKRLGATTWNGIIMNALVPFAFHLADQRGDEQLKERWVESLNDLPQESNSVVSKFEEVGFAPASAYASQALLQLHSLYCSMGNCVNCAIGSAILGKN